MGETNSNDISHLRETNSNDISPLKVHNKFHFQKVMHTAMESLCQSCKKNCEISNFLIVANLFSFPLTWDHMGEKNDILSESTQEIFFQQIQAFS